MAQNRYVPKIPIHCIPYKARYELAEVFDSPSVDGRRTLEGLADAIFEHSGYRVPFDHNTIAAIRSRCNSGESPTVRFIYDLSKSKLADLQLLQQAICSLDTRAEDILPKYMTEIIKRYEAENGRNICTYDDKSSQHACNCNDCSVSYNRSERLNRVPSGVTRHPKKQYHKHRCDQSGCVHNHETTSGGRQQPPYRNNISQDGFLPNNVEVAMSRSLNISDHSDIQNNIASPHADDYMSESHSMHLFGNGLGLFPPDDFNPCPPSDCGEDDEDDETWTKTTSMEASQSEGLLRPRRGAHPRRIRSEPIYEGSNAENTDNTRRHSHPIYQRQNENGPRRRDCESDGDIPNIPDACTCYRSPVINIGPRTVFVSLADDSKHHIKEVLTMCNKLKKYGFEVKCDMMESLFLEQNINVNEWLDQCFTRAAFVIFCISPKYYQNIGADNPLEAHPNDNRFHTRYIFDRARTEFIQNNSINRRFLPVLFRNSNARNSHIPEFLRSTLKYVFPDTFGHLTEFIGKSITN